MIHREIPRNRNVMKKEAEKKLKYKSLCIEITTNVKLEMCDYTGHNWSHRSSNKRLDLKFGGNTRKTTKTAMHVIGNVESTAV
jgi:hypothetical protein